MPAAATDPPQLPYRLVPGRGPFLFLVHGMLSSHRQWEPNLQALSQVSRPVLFDLWGHGDAACPLDDAPYERDALIGEFERVRRELGAERVVLCGQSLGGALVLRYSVAHPERVAAQIFTNSLSALSPPEALVSDAARQERAALLEREGAAGLERLPFHPVRAWRLAPEKREALVAMARQVDPRAVARLTRVTGPKLSVFDDLHRIACPTLLVNGALERRFQPLREVAARKIPGCRIADIEAGHAVNLEQPDRFDEAATRFLRTLIA